MNNRINKASSVFGCLRRNIWDRKDIQIETKMKIYNTAVLPTLLYASETWCLTKNITSKLEVFQMSCLRNIAGISKRRHTTNIEVRNICCKQPTIEDIVQKNRLRWLGHIFRMKDDSFCKLVWNAPAPQHWKCTRNAPKKTWLKVILEDLHHLKDTYGAARWYRDKMNIITDLANDRLQWKQLVSFMGQAAAVNNELQP